MLNVVNLLRRCSPFQRKYFPINPLPTNTSQPDRRNENSQEIKDSLANCCNLTLALDATPKHWTDKQHKRQRVFYLRFTVRSIRNGFWFVFRIGFLPWWALLFSHFPPGSRGNRRMSIRQYVLLHKQNPAFLRIFFVSFPWDIITLQVISIYVLNKQ